MSKATLQFEDKMTYPDGAVLEMRVWRLPSADAQRSHGLKYSLYYGKDGARIVGYDNERGKGDHRHYGDRQEDYVFTTIDQLVADFLDDVEKQRTRE
jgi:hypothetical protein